jgi:hypothetical protein
MGSDDVKYGVARKAFASTAPKPRSPISAAVRALSSISTPEAFHYPPGAKRSDRRFDHEEDGGVANKSDR